MDSYDPIDIARTIFYGDFRPCDDYFSFNGYANVVSFNYECDDNCPISIDDIAAYCDDNDDSLYNDDIQDILDEEDDESEGE